MSLAEQAPPEKQWAAADRRLSKKRRRPSGEPPPLPRSLYASGKYWAGLLVLASISWLGIMLISSAGYTITKFDVAVLRGFESVRTAWLTHIARTLDALGSEWVILILRWGIIATLLFFKRLRHLFVFVSAVLGVGLVTTIVSHTISRPRPFDVDIIGHWQGAAHPARPIAAFAVTLLGILYTLVVPGRARTIGKWIAAGLILLLGLSHLYLGVDHPMDIFAAVVLGVALPLTMFRLLTPNDSFPVSYKRKRAAHLDVEGPRGEAICNAIETQLGISLIDVEPFGLGGSAGSTPLRLRVGGEPPVELFGKLYAQTHLRSDRWYKLGRTLLYGRLEDEGSFSTVRRLVQYEDYLLRVMRDAKLPTPKPYGFVEITPEREYLLVTGFVHGARELLDADVDDDVIDRSLELVRQLWDAGLAHRDIKPSNILVTPKAVHLIDVAFGEVRPSPWRQAVDLANMMLVLALRTDATRVYRAALKHFTPDEIAEAFAATHGMTMPSQIRGLLKKDKRPLLDEFRALAPQHPRISIQRWSLRRLGLTFGVLIAGLVTLTLVLSNFRGAGLQPPADATTAAYSAVGEEPMCESTNSLVLQAQAVRGAALVPCIDSMPVGWSFSGLDVVDGRSRMFLDSDRAGFRAIDVTLASKCNTEGATEVITDEPGTRRYELVFPRDDRYLGSRFYVFEGGCVVYNFDLVGPGRAALAEEASVALSFFSRAELSDRVFEETGFEI